FQANAVPVFSSGPVDELSPDRYGAVSDEGLTIPLRNGEVFSLPDAVRVSQVLHTGIAIVDYANGDRTSIDLDTGETLTDLYPPSDNERIVGVYQFTPANDDMTDWRILDLRTGDETSTEHLFGTTFDMHDDPIAIAVDLAHPSTMLAQFVEANSGTGQPEPVSIESSTLLIPGSLEDATFTDQNHGYAFGLPQAVALETRDGTTMFAYVTDMPDAVIRVENGSSGETVATFTAGDIDAEGQVHIAGFVDNGTSLVVWSGSTVSLLELDDQATVTRFETNGDTIQHILGTSVILTSSREGASAMWNHLDLESGEWTEFPELDGFQPDRSQPQSPWVTLRAGGGPSLSMVIINDVTGEIVARLDDANLGMSTAVSPAHDFSALAITGNTGEAETTGYMLDATSGESWQIAPPDTNGSVPDGIFYSISPDGALLVATSHDPQGGDIETWVSPVQPEPEWTSIGPRSIDTWLYFPDDNSQDQTEVSGRILDCRVFLAT
ncbi:MAG: hypothetical protein H0V98_08395, partial [Chloroflexia bacterium]|nr:hypothetical protein [Chloroflexia bacterium]